MLNRHPSEEELLRYSDGELPGRRAAAVRAHLEACWQCRAEMEESQKIVSDCVRFRKGALGGYLPAPPAPWRDIRLDFAKADARLARRPFWARAGELLLAPARRPGRWVPATVALTLTFAIVYQLYLTPRVEAAELLRKAVAAGEASPSRQRRIRIQGAGLQLVQVIGSGAQADARFAHVQALFTAAHYDWRDPLSPAAYLAWHDQLAEKQDRVTSIAPGETGEEEAYLIRTTTQTGGLAQATLKLRERDLRAVEGTFQFRGSEPIHISEVLAEPSLARAPEAQAADAVPSSPALLPPAGEAVTAATASDELHVMAALHQIGADLGDPIEVVREQDTIRLTGLGIEPGRRQEIERAVDAIPRVTFDFKEPAETGYTSSVAQSARRLAPGPEVQRLQAQMEKYLGGRPAFDRFADQLLQSGDVMMSHAHALRRLAEHFPAAVAATLPPEDSRTLQLIREEHADAILRQATGIRERLNPALGSQVDLDSSPSLPASAAWQDNAAELFQAAKQTERLLAVLVGGAVQEASETEVAAHLLSSLHRVQAAVQVPSRNGPANAWETRR